jgi:hypothetical protein
MERIMHKILIIMLLATLTGCTHYPPRGLEEQRSYIDRTVSVPSQYFMETPESKSVHVGSGIFAQAAGCQYMQRYKVRTKVNFSHSLNLIKYRSAMMGAKRISVVRHEEVDALEKRIAIHDDNVIYLEAGTSLQGASFHTTIIADLYDCPKT